MAEGDERRYTETDLQRIARETAKQIYELQQNVNYQSSGSSTQYTFITRELNQIREDVGQVRKDVGQVDTKIDTVVLSRVGDVENRLTALEQKIAPMQRMFWLFVGTVITGLVTGVTALVFKGGI